ncbi:CPBP family intramembrane glutamic endopeptidase [Chitinophaga agri]|uniref:CPBP family intramembrane metalloprotease n=1 Tax=Chitinophaga agri TaxID=2703787 RepID=A0A6B9ZMU9_9BACT|nr:CPBP family intramembrane glutamic endopeptidase [Chitinophaga agri]QHS63572.1 CPBP family intramembrane metalloprotease [Chitinophaga agri]
MKNKVNYPAIITFYIIAVALRYLATKTPLLDAVSNDFLRVVLRGIGPAVGALVAFSVFRIKPVLSLKGNYKQLIAPFALYWVFPIALICGIEFFMKGSISFVAVSAILVYGLMEEIGWRGFLQQELKSLPPIVSILIVATLWFLWHLNFDLTSSNLLFFGIIILGTWGIGKVADTTASLLAVAAFHSLNNLFSELNGLKIMILVILITTWVVSLIIRKRYFKVSLA